MKKAILFTMLGILIGAAFTTNPDKTDFVDYYTPKAKERASDLGIPDKGIVGDVLEGISKKAIEDGTISSSYLIFTIFEYDPLLSEKEKYLGILGNFIKLPGKKEKEQT